MHSNRYTAAPERKHRNLPRVLAATAAMLCIAALLLVLSVVQSHTAAAVRNRDGFRLRSGENIFYSAAGNGLAAATTTGAQLFTASGKCAASADFAMTEPMCAAGTQLAGIVAHRIDRDVVAVQFAAGPVRDQRERKAVHGCPSASCGRTRASVRAEPRASRAWRATSVSSNGWRTPATSW